MTAKTLDQIREQQAFNRGFAAAKRAAVAICNNEQEIAATQHNLTIEGIAHGAERCRLRIEKLGTPQEHDGGTV